MTSAFTVDSNVRTRRPGGVPDGMDLDHMCHNEDPTCPGGWDCLHRRCVNPSHLVPATRAENNRRARERSA